MKTNTPRVGSPICLCGCKQPTSGRPGVRFRVGHDHRVMPQCKPRARKF